MQINEVVIHYSKRIVVSSEYNEDTYAGREILKLTEGGNVIELGYDELTELLQIAKLAGIWED